MMTEQQKKDFRVINDDSLKVLPTFEANSIDAIVTDPPYELGFMGKKWDATGIAYNVDLWKEALRVLKPGGYLLAFGGSRTFHRIACAIEDAGFEIRDCIMWLYGSGFPKSHNVGLDIDKLQGCENRGHRIAVANRYHPDGTLEPNGEQLEKYEGKTEDGKKWAGYGTCLKPAYEPIIMARKPIEGTVAKNCLKYGVGAINIDECRVDYNGEVPNIGGRAKHTRGEGYGFKALGENCVANTDGRFPANVIHDGSSEAVSGMPESVGGSGKGFKKDDYKDEGNIFKRGDFVPYNDDGSASRYFYCAKASKKDRDEGLKNFEEKESHKKGNGLDRVCEFCGVSQLTPELCHCEVKSWVAKPRKNIHPTVKPVELMQYLVRLVSPKGSTILDIFNGSGSTGKAVAFENRERDANYKYIGIELDPEYCTISEARIDYALNKYQYDIQEEIEELHANGQMSIFDFGVLGDEEDGK